MKLDSSWRFLLLASVIFLFDQVTKWIVLRYLGYSEERVIVEGFFKFVHWHNTGAAWSLFSGRNGWLAVISLIALVLLIVYRRRFDAHTRLGGISMGLLLGGIAGNVTDRLLPSRQHVIDFIYFYMERRGGTEIGFPAFNVADSAICVGVGLMFLISWRKDMKGRTAPNESAA